MIEYIYPRYEIKKDDKIIMNTADHTQAESIAKAYSGTIEEYTKTTFITEKEAKHILKIKGNKPMTRYYRDYAVTASIKEHRDGTTTLRVDRAGHVTVTHHKSFHAALRKWYRLCA